MNKGRLLNLFVIIIAAFLFVGCAGPRFSPVTDVPGNQAVVYIYRKSALGGIANNHHVFANGKPVTSLYSGSYFPYLATPGTNYFSSQAAYVPGGLAIDAAMNINFRHRVCQIDAQPGKTYYVQFEIATSWGPKMTLVDAETGAKDIQKCRLAKPLKD